MLQSTSVNKKTGAQPVSAVRVSGKLSGSIRVADPTSLPMFSYTDTIVAALQPVSMQAAVKIVVAAALSAEAERRGRAKNGTMCRALSGLGYGYDLAPVAFAYRVELGKVPQPPTYTDTFRLSLATPRSAAAVYEAEVTVSPVGTETEPVIAADKVKTTAKKLYKAKSIDDIVRLIKRNQ